MSLVNNDGTKFSENASNQFEAILQNTEEATENIIDAVSNIAELVKDKLSGDEPESFEAEISKVYEACNFQDLTAQRIRKVTEIIDTIESRLSEMSNISKKALPYDENEGYSSDGSAQEGSLLNGPQTSDVAPSQDEIDKLFGSL
jgi:chemotaxis protein CheZ